MRVGREHVDARAADVDRQRSQALNRVDDEEDAALAAERADLFERIDVAVVEGDPGDGDDARPRVHLLREVGHSGDAAVPVLREAARDAASSSAIQG